MFDFLKSNAPRAIIRHDFWPYEIGTWREVTKRRRGVGGQFSTSQQVTRPGHIPESWFRASIAAVACVHKGGVFSLSKAREWNDKAENGSQQRTLVISKWNGVILFDWKPLSEATKNCQRRRCFTSPWRGIGKSFQLAIVTPRLDLTGYDTASAQS